MGSVRWRKDKGVAPSGQGSSEASLYPCDVFSVVATDPTSGKVVVSLDQIASPFQRADVGDYYVCNYAMQVPPKRSLRIIATMGGIMLLPQENRSPRYWTDAWIGGSRSKPPKGWERGFTGYEYVTLSNSRLRATVNFEMVYVQVDPN
jgi:hypothetical protein